MGIWYAAFVVACIVLFVVPITLVFNDDYEDRILGRLGLLGIAFFAAIFLSEIFFGGGYHIEREEAGLFAMMALFLLWHLRTFCKRIKKKKQIAAVAARELIA